MMRYQFYVSFVGKTLFFRDVCIFQNVVNFGYDFTLLSGAVDAHYNFSAKKETVSCQFYVSFVGETFFSETCTNCKVLSISNGILPCYLV